MAIKRRKPFEGHVYQRKNGLWEWKITLPNGERRSFYGKTERAARDKKNRAIRDFEEGLARQGEKITVNQYMQRWLDETAAERLRPSTLATYTSHFETHIKPAMQRVKLRDLSPEQVNRMLSAIVAGGASPTTANRVRATLRTALASAVKSRMISFNAASLSDARTEKRKRPTLLTVKQAQYLITQTRKHRMGPMIETDIYMGLRQGELLGLTKEFIDLKAETLHVEYTLVWVRNPNGDSPKWIPQLADPKTEQSKRTLKMPKPVVQAIERQMHLNQEMEAEAGSNWDPIPGMNLVFPNIKGKPLNDSNVTNRFKGILEDLKLPHQRFHDLRHLTASLLLAEGMDIFTVKEILGHSQIAQTADTYGHLMLKLSEIAAERLGSAIFDDSEEELDG